MQYCVGSPTTQSACYQAIYFTIATSWHGRLFFMTPITYCHATHLLITSAWHVCIILGSDLGLRLAEVHLPVLDLHFATARFVARIIERTNFGADSLQVRGRR